MTCAFDTAGTAAKSKLAQALVRRQMAVGAGTCEPPRLALVHLLLEQHTEEALCWPAFAVGLLGQVCPQPLDRGQPQLGQHDRQACRIGGGDGGRCCSCGLQQFVVHRRGGQHDLRRRASSVGRGAKRSRNSSMSGNSPRSCMRCQHRPVQPRHWRDRPGRADPTISRQASRSLRRALMRSQACAYSLRGNIASRSTQRAKAPGLRLKRGQHVAPVDAPRMVVCDAAVQTLALEDLHAAEPGFHMLRRTAAPSADARRVSTARCRSRSWR